MIKRIGLGGGCHWCTEAVFASLKGVLTVDQGWITSEGENTTYSEGIVLEFDTSQISIDVLIAIHLHTHSATAMHSMRGKYRSAVYYFNAKDCTEAKDSIQKLQKDFDAPIITMVIPFVDFRLNKPEQLNYYYTDPTRPFCETYINPKLKLLLQRFSENVDRDKLQEAIKPRS